MLFNKLILVTVVISQFLEIMEYDFGFGSVGNLDQNISEGESDRLNISFDYDLITGQGLGLIDIPVVSILGPCVDIYLTIFFIIIGSVGNLLSIVAVTSRHSKHSKKSSFYVYVLALAIADTLSLYSMNAEKMSSRIFNFAILNYSEAICKLIKYLEELLPHISSWIIVCITLERCLCASLPHKFALFSRPKIGYIMVASVSVILMLLNLHLLVGFVLHPVDVLEPLEESSTSVCYIENEIYSDFYTYYWNWITLSVYCLLPFVIIVSTNTITVFQVKRSARLVGRTSSKNSGRKARRLLLVTLLVSITFVLLALPEPLLEVWRFEVMGNTIDRELLTFKTGVLLTIFKHMKTLSHAVNFWLYVVSGRQFRQNLKAAFVQPCRQTQTDKDRQIRLFQLRSVYDKSSTPTCS